jgi:hypothetical protein
VKKEKSCLIDRRKNYERIEAAITTSEKNNKKKRQGKAFEKFFINFL